MWKKILKRMTASDTDTAYVPAFFFPQDDWGYSTVQPSGIEDKSERKKAFAAKKIPLAELDELFSGILDRAQNVQTADGVSNPATQTSGAYAFVSPTKPSAALYGTVQSGGDITELCYSCDHFPQAEADQIVPALERLGERYELTLYHYGTTLIPLTDKELMQAFLSGNREKLDLLMEKRKK